MIKSLFKYVISKNRHKAVNDALASYDSFVVSIFSRYGDGVIALKILKEFAQKYPNKRFLIITTPQLLPYANEFFPNLAISLNKRNPIALIKTAQKIKAFDADMGLNPWSFGDESKFLISLAKRYKDFTSFKEFSKIDNLYDRAREYLGLDLPKREICYVEVASDIKNIIFVPFSTDITKSLDISGAQQIIKDLTHKYKEATIWLCGFKHELARFEHNQKFYFKRSGNSSKQFLDLLKQADLFVGVDAGPLHLAMALDIKSIGIFGPTAPQTIVDSYQNAIVWRNKKLDGTFCFVESCKNPICLKNGFSSLECYNANLTLATQTCPYIGE